MAKVEVQYDEACRIFRQFDDGKLTYQRLGLWPIFTFEPGNISRAYIEVLGHGPAAIEYVRRISQEIKDAEDDTI